MSLPFAPQRMARAILFSEGEGQTFQVVPLWPDTAKTAISGALRCDAWTRIEVPHRYVFFARKKDAPLVCGRPRNALFRSYCENARIGFDGPVLFAKVRGGSYVDVLPDDVEALPRIWLAHLSQTRHGLLCVDESIPAIDRGEEGDAVFRAAKRPRSRVLFL